jgi:6-pyruvoyl-tetrahydropterin synthase
MEVRRAELDADGLVCDIGKALDTLKAVLGEINYRNLDELPAFKGRNTTTEFLAGEIFRRLKSRIASGALGDGTASALSAMRVSLRESPVAWAAFEGSLV